MSGMAQVTVRPSWITSDLMERLYDKHGPDFRHWVILARSGKKPGNYGGGGPPSGWCGRGLDTDGKGEPGLWIDDGNIMKLFVPARFLVDVEFQVSTKAPT